MLTFPIATGPQVPQWSGLHPDAARRKDSLRIGTPQDMATLFSPCEFPGDLQGGCDPRKVHPGSSLEILGPDFFLAPLSKERSL